MKEDRSKGIDGHNPRDERREALKLKYLKEYQIQTIVIITGETDSKSGGD